MSNQPIAVTAVRGPAKELPDNSGVRLTVDIDQNFIQLFHQGFRAVGQPVTLARLTAPEDDGGNIVMGVRRPAKEMPDGTLRVTVDIDPAFRNTFFQNFRVVGEPIALVAIRTEAANPTTRKGGRLTKLAGEMCRHYGFRLFVSDQRGQGMTPADEDLSAMWLRKYCGVNSRRDLDYEPEAAERFRLLQAKFIAWAQENRLESIS